MVRVGSYLTTAKAKAKVEFFFENLMAKIRSDVATEWVDERDYPYHFF